MKSNLAQRQLWTRDKLIKTLALYCQIPFGKMHSNNKDVVALSKIIGRTPSAVALKLVNFASLDPDLKDRNIRGMSNSSKIDKDIWNEYYGKWDTLAENSIFEDLLTSAQVNKLKIVPVSQPSGPTEVIRETKIRRGQHFFRMAVLAAHKSKCCITGITSESLLRASHIVPWAHDQSLRLDPRNGLCLNALHDAAFDRGLITISDKLELKISRRLKTEVPTSVYQEMFENRAGMVIELPERFRPSFEMLKFHQTKIFCA